MPNYTLLQNYTQEATIIYDVIQVQSEGKTQARSQKILLGSAFEENVDLLILSQPRSS